ncbi:phosphatase inhibitor-domain-containing protein [Thamnidium elegans]|nr:phosphatase inhibitor-domain-containing protein [Thamnidium elegans]
MSQSPHPETFTRMREETPTTAHGSRTLIVEDIETQSGEESSNDEDVVGVLRLRGDMNSRRPRAIHWDESVIDNEHMNKKKTKICCIYHKPHAIGESSESESSSSSDSDNSSSSEDERPHVNGKCTHKHTVQKKKKKRNPREVSPNAYERQPVYKDRSKK